MSSNNDTTVTFTAQQYQMILTLGNAANAAIQLAESQGQPRIGISNARAVQGCPPPVARNRPYVEPKLRGRMVCLANRTASRFLRRAPQTAHAAARSIRDKRAPTGSLTRQRNRDSSSCSQQHGLYRRPARPERRLALILLRRSALPVRQDLRNQLRLLDAGDDLQLPAAARAALDLYTEHSLQPSCPAHRHMPGRRRLDRISPRHRRRRCTPAPLRRSPYSSAALFSASIITSRVSESLNSTINF